MLAETLRFLFTILSDFFILLVLLRFYLQVVKAPFQHPLAQLTMSLTNFAVLPLRRVIPSVRGYDSASLFLAFCTAFFVKLILLYFFSFPLNFLLPLTWISIVFLACLELIRASIHLLMGVVIVQAIFSWVSPFHPIVPLLQQLSAPFLAPLKRAQVQNIDLSPLILLLILQILLMLPIAWLEQTLLNLLLMQL